jgi:L-fuculose-phosphate aldolase
VNVVVHAHPPHVIGICSAGAEIRPMTPDAAAYLYPIRQIPFITPGGQELADAVAGSVEDGTNTVVMENHGTVTLGRSCREAFMRTELLEEEAKIQSIACAAGNPHFLTDSQVQDIRNLNVEKYRQEKAAETDSI